jgi:hypothetical protein
MSSSPSTRPRVRGRSVLVAGGEKLHVCGVTYGTFGLVDGSSFPPVDRVRRDFGAMAAAGVNVVRTYLPPPVWMLDAAQAEGMRVMVGLAWEQHVAFLEDSRRTGEIVAEDFQLALGIDPRELADLEALSRNGWQLLDPTRVAGTPAAYRDFVRGSKAELCVAKSGYVASRSGWFSDRSACYLATGRPVVAQETGFGERLPTGEGLLAFATIGEAAESVAEVAAHPDRHRVAARALAEEHLDARKVLPDLLQQLSRKP